MIKNYFFSIIFLSIYSAWSQPGSQSEILTLDSYQAFQGYAETTPHLGLGQYQIFYDNINGVLDKPFIIVDGFDPDDSNTIPILYNSLTYNAGANNLLDDMRNQGMDVIILSFPTYTRTDDAALIHGGADYIERNGLVLVNLLQTINAQIPVSSDCIVMGVSMGGLVSRYALTFMEQNSMDHNTGLWFSFDSPHRGANVPISLQYALNYIAEYSDDDDMRAQRDLTLNSPAAKQMLLDHYTAHLQSGDPYLQNTAVQLPTPATTFRSTFANTMNTLGFPTQARKVAIANGSSNNTMVGFPGAEIVNTTLNLGSNVYTQIKMYFTPNANVSNFQVDYIRTALFNIVQIDLFTAVAASPSTSAGLDSAPGGTVLFEDYVGVSTDPLIQQLINAINVEAFCFIPTLSSLAVENPNWYSSVNFGMVTNFETYFAPTINEPHVTLSAQNLSFILNEINNHYLGTDDLETENELVLINNPTQDWIRFKYLQNQNSEIEVVLLNTSGQILNQKRFYNSGEILEIEAPYATGLYVLQVKTENGIYIQKVMIR